MSTEALFKSLLGATLALAMALAFTPSVSAGTPDVEVIYWKSVNQRNVAELQSYLQTYPNGKFAPLAKARIEELGHAGQAPAPPTGSSTALPVIARETEFNLSAPDVKVSTRDGRCAILIPLDWFLPQNRPGAFLTATDGQCLNGLLNGEAVIAIHAGDGRTIYQPFQNNPYERYFLHGYPIYTRAEFLDRPIVGRFRFNRQDYLELAIAKNSKLGIEILALYRRSVNFSYQWCNYSGANVFVLSKNAGAFLDIDKINAVGAAVAQAVTPICRNVSTIGIYAGPDPVMRAPLAQTGYLAANLVLRNGVWELDTASNYANYAYARSKELERLAALAKQRKANEIAADQAKWDDQAAKLSNAGRAAAVVWGATGELPGVSTVAQAAATAAMSKSPVRFAAIVRVDDAKGDLWRGDWPRPFAITHAAAANPGKHGWTVVQGAATLGKLQTIAFQGETFELPLVKIDAERIVPCEQDRCREGADIKSIVAKRLGPRPEAQK